MVAIKSLWMLFKTFSTNLSFKRDNGVKVSVYKPDNGIHYNRLQPQRHLPYYRSSDAETRKSSTDPSTPSLSNLSENDQNSVSSSGYDSSQSKKDIYSFYESDTDYEDWDSDFDDFTTTDEDYDSDLDDDDEDWEKVLVCDVCERAFPSTMRLADHRERKMHYGCSQRNNRFPTEKTQQFPMEALDHSEISTEYGNKDATSLGSARSVKRDSSSGCSSDVSLSSYKCGKYSTRGAIDINENSNQTRSFLRKKKVDIFSKMNYHCYTNKLNARWYDADDEEEKGLLNTRL